MGLCACWRLRRGQRLAYVAVTTQAVHVCDSKDVTGPDFAVGRDGWARFVRYAAAS
ncbi:DUF397 domain-containing protein [Streptomyces glaucescens]